MPTISNLPPLITPNGTEIFPVVTVNTSTGVTSTKKASFDQVSDYITISVLGELANVAGYATIAANSATIATTQAGLAINASTIAANSATIATTQAGLAINASTIAANSATIATTQATLATNSATIILVQLDAAINASTIADNSATIATTQAGLAINASTIAANSATIATTQAELAVIYASTAIGYLAPVTSTSNTSNTIATGTTSFTIEPGKAWVAGHPIKIVSSANPVNNKMQGIVTAYVSASGSLTVLVESISGSGLYNDWVMSLTAAVAAIPQSSVGFEQNFLLMGA